MQSRLPRRRETTPRAATPLRRRRARGTRAAPLGASGFLPFAGALPPDHRQATGPFSFGLGKLRLPRGRKVLRPDLAVVDRRDPATEALRAVTSDDSTASARRRPLPRSDFALSLRIYVAVCLDAQTTACALRPAQLLRHARSRDLDRVLDDMPARRLQAQRLAHRRGT